MNEPAKTAFQTYHDTKAKVGARPDDIERARHAAIAELGGRNPDDPLVRAAVDANPSAPAKGEAPPFRTDDDLRRLGLYLDDRLGELADAFQRSLAQAHDYAIALERRIIVLETKASQVPTKPEATPGQAST